MKLSLVLLFLFSTTAYSQTREKVHAGYDPYTDIISDEYEAGAWLIYDCKAKSFVCVLESYYKECADKRLLDNNSEETNFRHSCAPMGSFPTKKSCFQRQLFLTTHNMGTRFCIKDEWKQKIVRD
jgi:hypothetical protein